MSDFEPICAVCLEAIEFLPIAHRWEHKHRLRSHASVLPDWLTSTICPRCGGRKTPTFGLCKQCEARQRHLLPPNRRKAPSQVLQERRDAQRAAEVRELSDEEREAYGLHRADCGCPEDNHQNLLALGIRHGPRDLTAYELGETV